MYRCFLPEQSLYKKYGYTLTSPTYPFVTVVSNYQMNCTWEFTDWLQVQKNRTNRRPRAYLPDGGQRDFLTNKYSGVSYKYSDDRAKLNITYKSWENIADIVTWHARDVLRLVDDMSGISMHYAMKNYYLTGKRGLVLASDHPIVEVQAIQNGASHILSVGQVARETEDVSSMSFLEFAEKRRRYSEAFDFVATWGTIESVGLGRYGDVLDAFGDLQMMAMLGCSLKKGGLFFLGIPMGRDAVIFNQKRIYGHARLPMLIAGTDGQTVGYEIIGDEIKYNVVEKPKIAIVSVLRSLEQSKYYDIAISTVKCYAKIQGYHYILAVEKDFECYQKDQFFRRHCIIAKILPNFDAVLFLDADIGVVYPKRRIEEYMYQDFDVIFYDRFYNWEIMAGSYLVINTPYAIKFLMDFANYESTLPDSFHGTDNGALHFFIAERFFPEEMYTIDLCRQPYKYSRDFDDVFTYEACLRAILGARTEFDRIKILKKGTGWARDSWITDGVWSKEIGDFMLHSWKTSQIQTIPNQKIKPVKTSMYEWFNPLVGAIHLDKCHSKNMSWNYDERLLGDSEEMMTSLTELRNKVTKQQFRFFYRMKSFV
ncbi:Protein CBG18973 [Caenorhabditis briggsae]|uniref:Protein CBG18973 n=1 Tax=Caenorhabditis briggsae TaxID=6238 RepID=A8XUG9_CAEBR|nr:Protein CBG18973 [Caenorhabditis briggsae]CAP36294.1 Protein CBG18973 [Caenorhabditis briggsae]